MIEFIDTTIRDGSYAFDFNYPCEDVLHIIKILKNSGVKNIEIGNGISLGMQGEHSKFTDYDYIEYLKNEFNDDTNFGAIYIPGMSDIEILKYAKKMGLKFIRIGEVSYEINNIFADLEILKIIGFEKLFLQVIKTNLINPKEFGYLAKKAEELGIDVIYIVDSNGSMIPSEITEYIYEVRKNSNLKIGFHGHNNHGCTLLNSYEFIKNGGDFVDVTLAGVGRGMGNTRFEDILQLMNREGYNSNIDINGIWEGTNYIEKQLHYKNVCNVDYRIMSYYNFDSNYYERFLNFAKNKKMKFDEVIKRASKKSNYVFYDAELEQLEKDILK